MLEQDSSGGLHYSTTGNATGSTDFSTNTGHAKDTEIIEPVIQQVGIHGQGWWRYRIPGQGLLDWPKFITVLLQAGFHGGFAVEHEDDFWDVPNTEKEPDFPQARKDGFILAARFLRQYLPARLG